MWLFAVELDETAVRNQTRRAGALLRSAPPRRARDERSESGHLILRAASLHVHVPADLGASRTAVSAEVAGACCSDQERKCSMRAARLEVRCPHLQEGVVLLPPAEPRQVEQHAAPSRPRSAAPSHASGRARRCRRGRDVSPARDAGRRIRWRSRRPGTWPAESNRSKRGRIDHAFEIAHPGSRTTGRLRPGPRARSRAIVAQAACARGKRRRATAARQGCATDARDASARSPTSPAAGPRRLPHRRASPRRRSCKIGYPGACPWSPFHLAVVQPSIGCTLPQCGWPPKWQCRLACSLHGPFAIAWQSRRGSRGPRSPFVHDWAVTRLRSQSRG